MPRANVVTRRCNCIDFLLTVVDTELYTVSTQEERVLRSEVNNKTDLIKFFNKKLSSNQFKVIEVKKLRNVRCFCKMPEKFYYYNSEIIETKEVN